MKYLKSMTYSELGRLPVNYIDENNVVVADVVAKVGDECLVIGPTNDIQNLILTKIEDTGVDNVDRIFNIYFNDELIVPVINTIALKFFGVY